MAVGRRGLVRMTTEGRCFPTWVLLSLPLQTPCGFLCLPELIASMTGLRVICFIYIYIYLSISVSISILIFTQYCAVLLVSSFLCFPPELQSLRNFKAQLSIARRWTWSCWFPEKWFQCGKYTTNWKSVISVQEAYLLWRLSSFKYFEVH